MRTEEITLVKLTVGEGMTFTNGESYGKEIYLGINDSAVNWQEITDEESGRGQKEEKTAQEEAN